MIDAVYRLTVNSFVAVFFFALACATTGTQAHPASKQEYNSLGELHVLWQCSRGRRLELVLQQ